MIMQTKALSIPVLFLFVSISTLLVMGIQSAQSEPPRLPFAYVVLESEGKSDYDLYVMDAFSGEIMYRATSPEYDCVESISPNGQWLSY